MEDINNFLYSLLLCSFIRDDAPSNNDSSGNGNQPPSTPPPPPNGFPGERRGGPPPESSSFGALAQIAVPENYPTVPVLPLYRNPVFPKFVKLVEVNFLFCVL